MKRLSAILFFCVLLFNFYGYRLMINYMQHQQDALLAARLEREQYRDEDLLSIKTPMQIPYYSGSQAYERVHGSIDLNGVTYEYVKRRVVNDTLELLCLPNKGRMHLQSAENEFFRLSLQGTTAQHDKQPTVIKIALPDYCQELPQYSFGSVMTVLDKHFRIRTDGLCAGYPLHGEQPPESVPHFS